MTTTADDYENAPTGLYCRACMGEVSEADLCFRKRCGCSASLVLPGAVLSHPEYVRLMFEEGAPADGE